MCDACKKEPVQRHPTAPHMPATSQPLKGLLLCRHLLRSTPHTPHTHSHTNGAAYCPAPTALGKAKLSELGKGPSLHHPPASPIQNCDVWQAAGNALSACWVPRGPTRPVSFCSRQTQPALLKKGCCVHCCCSNALDEQESIATGLWQAATLGSRLPHSNRKE